MPAPENEFNLILKQPHRLYGESNTLYNIGQIYKVHRKCSGSLIYQKYYI